MTDTVGKPAGREFEDDERELTCRENRSHDRGGNVLFLDPPQEIEAVHHALDRGDPVRQVENQVSVEPGSIRRH
jgi:hypothetical protein